MSIFSRKEGREVCSFWSILHPIPLQCGRRLREFWHNDLHSWEVHLFVEPSLKSKSDVHNLLSRKGAIYLHVSSNSYVAVFSFPMSHTFFGIRTSQSKTGSIIGQKKSFGGGRSLFLRVAFCRNDFFSISSDFQEMVNCNFDYVFLKCNQKNSSPCSIWSWVIVTFQLGKSHYSFFPPMLGVFANEEKYSRALALSGSSFRVRVPRKSP